MKLYWSSRSPFVRKVMVAAHEIGLAGNIEKVPVTVTPFVAEMTVLEDNPLIKIPTLVTDNQEVLYDSAVICEYLDGLHVGQQLIPAAGPERIEALKLQALGDGILEMLIFWITLRSRFEGPNLEALARATRLKLARTLDYLEERVDTLEAPHFHIGSITLGVALGYLDFRFDAEQWREGHPRLRAWYDKFAARPSAQATAPHD